MKKLILFLILSILSVPKLSAQYVTTEIDIIEASTYNFINEPFITFSPQNPDNLLIGANLNLAYNSSDGGYTWNKSVLTSDEYGVWGDPCVIADDNGNFYFFHLSNPPSENGTWVDRIVCQKSEDNGNTWNVISTVGLNGDKKLDKETAIFDKNSGNIYITWTQADAYHSTDPADSSLIMFSASYDSGQTWSSPYRLSRYAGDASGSDSMLRSAVPCIGPEGQIYVAWAGRKADGTLGIIFDKSTDQGLTWLDDDIFVCDMPGGSHFDVSGIYPGAGAGWPSTACDTSGGAYNGTVYINWADQRNGTDDADIWLIKSEDEGESWSEPVRVNNDAAGKQQFFTKMTIDQTTGNLYIIFYDRRNYDDNRTDVFLAVSEDGGETFSNIKLTPEPFLPSEDVFFGDFSGIIAVNNKVRPVWTQFDGNYMGIYTVEYEASEINQPEKSSFAEELSLYPNPSVNKAYLSFKTKETAYITLEVTDIYGRKIITLKDKEKTEPGKYIISFDAEKYKLLPGVYYFVLQYGDKQITKKFVLSR
ncbi:MAG: T9SS type A sorting domain-containing protein [Chlorobi bacterium]|nr:T9SS type A sorting domain-containing protein [Chlorobiota bacterium]